MSWASTSPNRRTSSLGWVNNRRSNPANATPSIGRSDTPTTTDSPTTALIPAVQASGVSARPLRRPTGPGLNHLRLCRGAHGARVRRRRQPRIRAAPRTGRPSALRTPRPLHQAWAFRLPAQPRTTGPFPVHATDLDLQTHPRRETNSELSGECRAHGRPLGGSPSVAERTFTDQRAPVSAPDRQMSAAVHRQFAEHPQESIRGGCLL